MNRNKRQADNPRIRLNWQVRNRQTDREKRVGMSRITQRKSRADNQRRLAAEVQVRLTGGRGAGRAVRRTKTPVADQQL